MSLSEREEKRKKKNIKPNRAIHPAVCYDDSRTWCKPFPFYSHVPHIVIYFDKTGQWCTSLTLKKKRKKKDAYGYSLKRFFKITHLRNVTFRQRHSVVYNHRGFRLSSAVCRSVLFMRTTWRGVFVVICLSRCTRDHKNPHTSNQEAKGNTQHDATTTMLYRKRWCSQGDTQLAVSDRSYVSTSPTATPTGRPHTGVHTALDSGGFVPLKNPCSLNPNLNS